MLLSPDIHIVTECVRLDDVKMAAKGIKIAGPLTKSNNTALPPSSYHTVPPHHPSTSMLPRTPDKEDNESPRERLEGLTPRVLFVTGRIRRGGLVRAGLLALLIYTVLWQSLEAQDLLGANRAFSSSTPSCAILFYGEPKAFSDVVWPALQKHVIQPNAAYGCDYFGHAMLETDTSMDELAILARYMHNELPKDPATRHLPRPAAVQLFHSTHEQFVQVHADLLHRVETATDERGRSIYKPWKKFQIVGQPSVVETLQQWYSMQQAWTQMEAHTPQPYQRIAILPWDVVYMTPVDIYQYNSTHRDVGNKRIVLPGRSTAAIYGPRRALQVWATKRFSHMDAYVQEYRFKAPGTGLDQFVKQSLVPRMYNPLAPRYEMVVRRDWCLYRVRHNHGVWISDGSLPGHGRRDASVAYVTGCTCSSLQKLEGDIQEIICCADSSASNRTGDGTQ